MSRQEVRPLSTYRHPWRPPATSACRSEVGLDRPDVGRRGTCALRSRGAEVMTIGAAHARGVEVAPRTTPPPPHRSTRLALNSCPCSSVKIRRARDLDDFVKSASGSANKSSRDVSAANKRGTKMRKIEKSSRTYTLLYILGLQECTSKKVSS